MIRTSLLSTRRIAALAVAAGLALSACSSSAGGTTSSNTTTTAPSSSSAVATTSSSDAATTTSSSTDTAAFPATIKHAFGETTIPAAPKRVVTISWQNQDVVLALGVQPIAIPKVTYGGDSDFLYPWFHTALGSDPIPTLMDENNGLDFEAISAAKPDLILGVYSGMTDSDYATLSAIAPTVAYPDAAYATGWTDTTTIIGKALGKSTEAAALIATTESYLKDKGSEFPQLAGKSFAYAYPNDTGMNVYVPTDARVSLLTSLGLTVAPSVTAISAGATSYFVPLPFEQVDKVTSDILVLIADDDAAKTALLARPEIAALPQVTSGAYVVLVGQQFIMSLSAPSVLSIPWGFDQFVPELAAAADKVA